MINRSFWLWYDVSNSLKPLLALCGTKANPLRLGTVLIAIDIGFRELRPMTS